MILANKLNGICGLNINPLIGYPFEGFSFISYLPMSGESYGRRTYYKCITKTVFQNP